MLVNTYLAQFERGWRYAFNYDWRRRRDADIKGYFSKIGRPS